MTEEDELLLARLLPIFKEEARERIATIVSKIVELNTAGATARAPLVEIMFREAHSLKAAARAVDQSEIELICQAIESIFAAVKADNDSLTPPLLQTLQDAADSLEDLLASLGASPSAAHRARAAALVSALNVALQGIAPALASGPDLESAADEALVVSASASEPAAVALPAPVAPIPHIAPMETPPSPHRAAPPAAAPPAAAPLGGAADTVRLSVPRLNALLTQTEEMVSQKSAARQLAAELGEALTALSGWKNEWDKVRREVPRSRPTAREQGASDPIAPTAAAQLFNFLERTESRVEALAAMLLDAQEAAVGEARNISAKVDGLLYSMKQVLMLQCGSLTQLFPRVVRDLALDQGKTVELTIRGAQLEIDRRILDELKDPLLHLLRNCVDHGIEPPEARRAAGKSPRATIVLTVAARDGDKVEFTVADDGAGIATEKLAAAAVKMGLLPAEHAQVSHAELLPLIFQSGMSTSPMITDVSGRGLGMTIVREKVERLGGSVLVESQPGHGTTFRLVVPLTLATYHGIVVRVGARAVVLPTLNAERVVRVARTTVSMLENCTVIDVGGTSVPIVRLRDILEIPDPVADTLDDRLIAVVLGNGAGQVAFEVDTVEGDQEILVKPLGKCLVRVRNVQGATILPTGEIAPILNVNDLLKSAVNVSRTVGQEIRPLTNAASAQKRILLAEDSITARGLLRSILEANGYYVKTADDGLEAWSMLKLEPFDLLLSDVEMPRMNGFELTTRVRADKNLTGLPVVLVTALESREDLERGADAGANAYIPKGSFEQSRLLEAVRRLA